MRRRLGPLLFLVLAACGQDDDGIGQRSSDVLSPQVRQVRTSAANGDRAGAEAMVAELRQTVTDLRERGELTEAGAANVLAAAAEVEATLGSSVTPTTHVSPTTRGESENGGTTRTTKKADREKDDKEKDDKDDDD